MADMLQWGGQAAIFLLFFLTGLVHGGSYCTTDSYSSVTYCSTGCCGSYGNEYCCNSNVALIVGCVLGSIFVISCVTVLICCCIKKKAHSGKVITPATGSLQPRPGTTTATVTTTTIPAGVHVHPPQQMAVFSMATGPAPPYGSYQGYPTPGTGAYGYSPNPLPPLRNPPANNNPTAPPSAYDMYHAGTAGGHTPVYGYGQGQIQGQHQAPAQPTTKYGGNFIA